MYGIIQIDLFWQMMNFVTNSRYNETQTTNNGIPADMDGMPDCDGSDAL